jgi:ATPase family associated with various cellular activities (AAA)
VPRAPLPIKEFDELAVLVRSHHPLIWIDADEPERVEVLLEYLCGVFNLPYFEWAPGTGLRRQGQSGPVYGTQSLVAALTHIAASKLIAIYSFNLVSEALDDGRVISLLLEVADELGKSPGAVVISSVEKLPIALTHAFARIALCPPTRQEYYDYVGAILADVRLRQSVAQLLDGPSLHRLLSQLQGLTLMEVRRLLTLSLVEHGALDQRAIETIAQAKGRSVAQSSVLQYFPVASGFERIGGMQRLKAWLAQRDALFREPERARQFGLVSPRGVLLLGVQGCGKSHTAQAIAATWQLPMLRLDAGRLYDKYVGATEQNLARALAMAERLAPVVLWVDEIEKALASGGDGDGGVSQRILGMFLTWLQERQGNVFVVATANDIARLPPELLRKGRFDEIFFVDLPAAEARREIFALHLAQRGRTPGDYDLEQLAALAEGFSGSEIAQAISASLFAAFNAGGELRTELIAAELLATQPISVTMREQVSALREWAHGRTVSAD